MDKPKRSWAWIEEHMPGVVRLIKAKRAEGLGDLVNECWRRGVVNAEPGWFYACEGVVAIGVPASHWLADPTVQLAREHFPGKPLLMLKDESHGQA